MGPLISSSRVPFTKPRLSGKSLQLKKLKFLSSPVFHLKSRPMRFEWKFQREIDVFNRPKKGKINITLERYVFCKYSKSPSRTQFMNLFFNETGYFVYSEGINHNLLCGLINYFCLNILLPLV